MVDTQNGGGEMNAKKLTAFYSVGQAGFWMVYCISNSFAAVYLGALGYSNTALGALLALGSAFGFVLGTVLSDIVDRSERITADRLLWALLAAQAAAFAVLLLTPRQGVVTSVCYPLLLMISLSVNTLNLKLCADYEHLEMPINFGVSRSIGSAAYSVVSLLLGELIVRSGVRAVPIAGLVVTAVQLGTNALFAVTLSSLHSRRSSVQTTVSPGKPLGTFLRGNPRFCLLLGGMALVFFAHNTSSTFLIDIVRHAGGGTETLGYINAFITALEIPAMILYSVYGRRKSRAGALRMAFLFFAVKAVFLALAPNVPLLCAAESLQTVSYAVYAPAIVAYVSLVIPYEDSAKGQSLANSMTTVGGVLASLISGRLFDVFSVPVTLWISAAVCAVGALLACRGLEKPCK